MSAEEMVSLPQPLEQTSRQVEEYQTLSARMNSMEKVMLEQVQLLREKVAADREQSNAMKALGQSVTEITSDFKMIVSNVLDIRNGIVPPELMMIVDHRTIIENQASLNNRVMNKVLISMSLLLLSAMGIQLVTKYLSHLFG